MFSTGGGGCEEAYGFLPCSNSLAGSVSLIVAYGYILLQGANLISDGSELLLEVSWHCFASENIIPSSLKRESFSMLIPHFLYLRADHTEFCVPEISLTGVHLSLLSWYEYRKCLSQCSSRSA